MVTRCPGCGDGGEHFTRASVACSPTGVAVYGISPHGPFGGLKKHAARCHWLSSKAAVRQPSGAVAALRVCSPEETYSVWSAKFSASS